MTGPKSGGQGSQRRRKEEEEAEWAEQGTHLVIGGLSIEDGKAAPEDQESAEDDPKDSGDQWRHSLILSCTTDSSLLAKNHCLA